MPLAEFHLSKEGEIHTIKITGRVDSSNASELGCMIDQILDEASEGFANIILDLEQVEYMSSAGLREMVRTTLRAEHEGNGELGIALPSFSVQDVLQLAGLSTFWDQYDPRPLRLVTPKQRWQIL